MTVHLRVLGTLQIFFFYLNQFLLFQGSYAYGNYDHDLLQLHVIMCSKK